MSGPAPASSGAVRPVRKAMAAVARPVNMGPSERWLSVLAGAGIAAFGLTRKHRIPGVALTMIGAGLVYRGVSGHCDVYGVVGIDRSPDRRVAVEESMP